MVNQIILMIIIHNINVKVNHLYINIRENIFKKKDKN